MKRVRDLFEKMISDENLGKAIDEVNKSHRWKKGHRPNELTAWVEETKPERIVELRQIILDGFAQKKPRIIERYDAAARKTRVISEPIQWPDQYIHHSLIQVIKPVCMRGMDHFCCGSIKGRGPHNAKKAIQKWLKNDRKGTRYELCGDIYHFYDSLKPSVVMARMRQLIKDHRVLDLIERTTKNGILIGAYPSQWFANTTLQSLDQLIRNSGLCKHYVRYMDNLTIFGPNKRNLRKLKDLIVEWLHAHSLELKGDWQIFPIPKDDEEKKPINPPRRGFARARRRLPDAVGYRYGREYSIPRKHNLIRLKRGIARYRKRKRLHKRIMTSTAAGLLSRWGQLAHCNNHNIYRMLFDGQRIIRELKRIVRDAHKKEELTWNMYLEQRRMQRSSKQKEVPTQI